MNQQDDEENPNDLPRKTIPKELFGSVDLLTGEAVSTPTPASQPQPQRDARRDGNSSGASSPSAGKANNLPPLHQPQGHSGSQSHSKSQENQSKASTAPTGTKKNSSAIWALGAGLGVISILGFFLISAVGLLFFFHPWDAGSPRAIMDKSKKSIAMVVVATEKDGKLGSSQGTGFFVRPDLIATNHHVIRNAIAKSPIAKVRITDNIHPLTAVMAVYDSADHDLALLFVPGHNAEPLPIADTKSLHLGDKVYAIGNPLGLEGTLTEGSISAETYRELDSHPGAKWIQHTAIITHGNSGGPLLNTRGEVVGINTLGLEGGIQLSLAACDLKAALDDPDVQAKVAKLTKLSEEQEHPSF